MNLDYCGDLHIDYHLQKGKPIKDEVTRCLDDWFQTQQSDTLLLTGDISNRFKITIITLEHLSQKYKQIFMVFGNHDYYIDNSKEKYQFNRSSYHKVRELEKTLPSNIRLLKDFERVTYNGVTLAGDTFWYPLETTNQLSFFHDVMNDSKDILKYSIKDASKQGYEHYNNLDRADIIITHIPPIITETHIKDGRFECYLTPVDEFRADHWLFGHVHEQCSFEKGYCKFHTNAIGYKSEKLDHRVKTLTL